MIENIALFAAVVLPFFNLPLIFRIIRRRSSEDISVVWALGIWVCLILMAPSAFCSKDTVWRVFSVINLALFSLVVFFVLLYSRPKGSRLKPRVRQK
ncbi:MAG: hypothetical protein A2987_03175 [Omnitrophica bacterium RIFCSPLOWO2_01_FULL_45_10]|nr:MAG: hypothetical protein A2987_03175 [Omnitrophica bacterium RIFCSPLOWO2_01_FULL_45_10]